MQIIIDIYNYGFYSYDHVYSNDKELIKLVVNMHPHSIKYISNELKNDIEIITRVLLKYVSKNQQDDWNKQYFNHLVGLSITLWKIWNLYFNILL